MKFENEHSISELNADAFEEKLQELPERIAVQFRLARKLYTHDVNTVLDLSTTEGQNALGDFWTGSPGPERSYSRVFREIEDHPEFHGDIHDITVDDLWYVREKNIVPNHLRNK